MIAAAENGWPVRAVTVSTENAVGRARAECRTLHKRQVSFPSSSVSAGPVAWNCAVPRDRLGQ